MAEAPAAAEPAPAEAAPAATPEAAAAEPAEAQAAPAPEPAAPEPASGTPAELSGEEPGGGSVQIEAAAGGGAGVEAPAEEPPAAVPGDEAASEQPVPAAGEAPAAQERAPSSPAADPAFQAVLGRARAVAQSQGHNNPAQRKAAEAQAAAPGPANEVQDAAAGQQVGKMAEQEPAPFDKEAFKAALMAKIAAIAPKNLEQADEFKENNKAGSIKGDVAGKVQESKEGTAKPVKDTAAETPATGGVEPKPVEALPPTDPGAAPPDIGAESAAPKPKTEAEVSLQQNSQEISTLTESSDPPFNEELVEKSNEPEFHGAHDATQTAKQDAADRPAEYRAQEQAVLGGAQQEASSQAANQTQAMHGARGERFSAIVENQGQTQTEDQARRAGVLQHVRAIYDETKQQVEQRLSQLDGEANSTFDSGAESARQSFESYVDQRMSAYKDERYGGLGGAALWLADKLLGLPDEVNVFYTEGRDLYIQLMDGVIDGVAGIVAAGLNEAMALIAAGKQRISDYLAGLPAELQQVGQEASQGIQGEFDSLAQTVTSHQDQLVDSLAQRYTDNLSAIDARIGEMKAANRGLVDAALDAVRGVLQTILELKNMLLGVLARASDVIGTILADPIGFLGNLVAAVRLGLDNFLANIGTHLQQGLMGWLFGALAEAGITMPETFDLKGILSLVLQVLGLTYANIRARAVKIVGEPVVKALETAAEIFRILITEGPAGLWQYVKDQLSNLGDVIIGGIKSFVIERIIIAGITWLIGMLNPASAFIKACKMIYDVVMFFVTRAQQIMAFVNAVLDSLAAIAAGQIGGAAAAVENALARAVPVVIGFLAGLLGLSGISEKIREIIQKIQAPVNAAIDWVINKAVALVRAAGKLLGLGGKDAGPEEEDPEKAAKIAAGKMAMHTEEQQLLEHGEITKEHAEAVAAKVKTNHPVFKSVTVVSGEGTWDYKFEASPPQTEPGKPKADGFDQAELEKQKAKSIPNSDAGFGRGGSVGATVDLKGGDREAMPSIPMHGYQQGDHRGHLIGDRFGGPPSQLNLVPMHPTLNLSTFKGYENEVADKIEKTKTERGAALAFMQVSPSYPGSDDKDPAHYRPTSVTAGGHIITFKKDSNPPELDQIPLSRGGGFSNPSSGFFLTKVALNESDAGKISEQTGLSATLASAIVAHRPYSRYAQLSAAGLDDTQIEALRGNRRVVLNKTD